MAKGLDMDEDTLKGYAAKGLPDKTLAVLMDCDVKLFAEWPHLRKCIDKARAELQATLAGTFVEAAMGTAPDPTVQGDEGRKPDMRAGDTLLQRLGFFDEPLDREVVVTVKYDEDPVPDVQDEDAPARKPVNIGKVIATAVATVAAAHAASEPVPKRKRATERD